MSFKVLGGILNFMVIVFGLIRVLLLFLLKLLLFRFFIEFVFDGKMSGL